MKSLPIFPLLFFYCVLAGMMSGGRLLRQASAFLMNGRTAFVRGTSGLQTLHSPLRFRGGGGTADPLNNNDYNNNSLKRDMSASVSSSEKSKMQASTIDIEKEAKASLSIVGSSVKASTFYGVPYLDTRTSNEFRVLFVLGGPGAGKYKKSVQWWWIILLLHMYYFLGGFFRER